MRITETTGHLQTALKPHNIAVTILRAGTSTNGWTYPNHVLESATPLFEGAPAFYDHSPQHRSVRDVAGSYREVAFKTDSIQANLRLLHSQGADLIAQILEDRAAGLTTPDVGLSVDIIADVSPDRTITRISRVNSVDIVFMPSAGGSIDRLLEHRQEEQPAMDSPLATPTANPPDAVGAPLAAPSPVAPVAPALPAAQTPVVPAPSASSEVTPAPAAPTPSVSSVVTAAPAPSAPSVPSPVDSLAQIQEHRRAICADLLSLRLSTSNLPEPARTHLASRFQGRVFEQAELDVEITAIRNLLGQVTASATVNAPGASRITGVASMRDRLQAATDLLFGNAITEAQRASTPRPRGIRELFTAAGFDGQFGWEQRITQSNEVTTTVMANIVGTSMNKRLVADYNGQPKWWKPITAEVALGDMKAQTRIKLNDFASLTAVSENDAYSNLAWDDAYETYTPSKKGNLVYVTLETIINDDLRAVQRIPKKLARAAGVTINEAISALFTANSGAGSALVDTYYVFDASHHQSNLGSAALDATALQAAMVAIAKMTDSASKRLGLSGKWLLVPPDLEYTAFTLLNSVLQPGTADNDVNALKGRAQYIVVAQWTDVNNWYLLADPSEIELIEIGYLNGQDSPELMIQDDPMAGTVFTNDAISYKIRWIFGAGWLDYRGAYGAVVT